MPTTLQAASTRFLVSESKIATQIMLQNVGFEPAKSSFDRVLVVSSDPAMREQLNRVVAKRNLVARHMEWHELVPTRLQDEVSVVLLDACCDPDELVLCRQIRRKNTDVPIIVLDVSTNDETRMSFFYAQTPFYLVKPCCDDRIFQAFTHAKRLALLSRKPVSPDYSGLSMEEMEHRLIDDALRRSRGNRAQAAAQLGISEKTIYNKIKHFRISR